MLFDKIFLVSNLVTDPLMPFKNLIAAPFSESFVLVCAFTFICTRRELFQNWFQPR